MNDNDLRVFQIERNDPTGNGNIYVMRDNEAEEYDNLYRHLHENDWTGMNIGITPDILVTVTRLIEPGLWEAKMDDGSIVHVDESGLRERASKRLLHQWAMQADQRTTFRGELQALLMAIEEIMVNLQQDTPAVKQSIQRIEGLFGIWKRTDELLAAKDPRTEPIKRDGSWGVDPE